MEALVGILLSVNFSLTLLMSDVTDIVHLPNAFACRI